MIAKILNESVIPLRDGSSLYSFLQQKVKKERYYKGDVLKFLLTLVKGMKTPLYQSIYLPDGSMGKWLYSGNGLVMACTMIDYGTYYPMIANYWFDKEMRTVYFGQNIRLSDMPKDISEFMKKTEENVQMSKLALKEISKIAKVDPKDLGRYLDQLRQKY